MFEFFRKKSDNKICAPMNGICLDITECADTVFSGKAMGDGFMMDSEDDVICSPCDGELKMIFPTGHAFGVAMSNGTEVLVHIGLETVNLKGKHFEILASVNSRVKKGTPIIRVEHNELKKLGYDTSVLVIVTGKESVDKMHLNEAVNTGDVIIGD